MSPRIYARQYTYTYILFLYMNNYIYIHIIHIHIYIHTIDTEENFAAGQDRTAECRTMSPRNALHPGQALGRSLRTTQQHRLGLLRLHDWDPHHFWDPIIVAVPMHLEIFGDFLSKPTLELCYINR